MLGYVSADGSVVVGQAEGPDDREAFIWDQTHGMRSLEEVLTSQGVDLTGWRLTAARAISADGRTIVGDGFGPGGVNAWLAVLPEPGAAILIGVALLALAARARRRPARTA